MDGILLLGRKSCIPDIKFKFIECRNSYQLQNLKILSIFQGRKNSNEQNFENLNFFYFKIQGYTDISRIKINLWSHHLHT